MTPTHSCTCTKNPRQQAPVGSEAAAAGHPVTLKRLDYRGSPSSALELLPRWAILLQLRGREGAACSLEREAAESTYRGRAFPAELLLPAK